MRGRPAARRRSPSAIGPRLSLCDTRPAPWPRPPPRPSRIAVSGAAGISDAQLREALCRPRDGITMQFPS
eukprot:5134362-Lingulodinium_polyedra.AAC.1